MKNGKRFPPFAITLFVVVSVAMLAGCGGGSTQPLPRLTIVPTALPNGTSETPYSQTVHASGGVAPFSWTASAGALPHNVALGGSVTDTDTISGTPDTAAQGVAFTIKVTDSANQSASQSYTVSILLEPDTLNLSPPSLSFTPQLIGTPSGTQAETVTNTGSSPVVISSIAITGTSATDFVQINTCGSSVGPGANCTINATFTPSQLGPSSASITIIDSTVGSPHSVSLDGAGLTSGPNATWSAASVGFGSQTLNTTSLAESITLTNYGTAALNLSGIATTANFGEIDNCGSTLASGASCTVNVTFTPGSTGTLNGALSVADNAAGTPQIVSLSGTGISGMCLGKGQPCGRPPHTPCCSGLQCSPFARTCG